MSLSVTLAAFVVAMAFGGAFAEPQILCPELSEQAERLLSEIATWEERGVDDLERAQRALAERWEYLWVWIEADYLHERADEASELANAAIALRVALVERCGQAHTSRELANAIITLATRGRRLTDWARKLDEVVRR